MIDIQGADQLVALSRRLKEAGARDLERELSKAITAAVKPLRKALQESARQKLPSRGGLNERVAKSRVTTKKALSGRGSGSGVRVTAGGRKSQLSDMDQGSLRHPVYGNRQVWVRQQVQPGWWTEPTEEIGPTVQAEVQKALRRVADKIERGI